MFFCDDLDVAMQCDVRARAHNSVETHIAANIKCAKRVARVCLV